MRRSSRGLFDSSTSTALRAEYEFEYEFEYEERRTMQGEDWAVVGVRRRLERPLRAWPVNGTEGLRALPWAIVERPVGAGGQCGFLVRDHGETGDWELGDWVLRMRRLGARGLSGSFWELGTASEGRCAPCSCPEGATGESPGWNPGDHATQRSLCPERAHGTGCVWSPFAPLERDVMGWGLPRVPLRSTLGYRRAPRCGEGGRMSGECFPPKPHPLTSGVKALR